MNIIIVRSVGKRMLSGMCESFAERVLGKAMKSEYVGKRKFCGFMQG